jgi:uncharacterized protein with ATP-grasp and redox domains
MQCNATCIRCLVDRQEEKIRKWDEEDKKLIYMKAVTALIGESDENTSAPYLAWQFNSLYEKFFGEKTSYRKLKSDFNQLLLSIEAELEREREQSQDPLEKAMILSRIGNYIDFSALEHVDRDYLMELFETKGSEKLDQNTYQNFLKECGRAEHFLLIADNCGEIVLDKLFLKQLKKRFPAMKTVVMVKGKETINDATMEDVQEIGMESVSVVITNGNGIAGTEERMLSLEARTVLNEADVILAKGQANFETLHGCGRNIYYSFLCKCRWFSEKFKVPKFTGMFVCER